VVIAAAATKSGPVARSPLDDAKASMESKFWAENSAPLANDFPVAVAKCVVATKRSLEATTMKSDPQLIGLTASRHSISIVQIALAVLDGNATAFTVARESPDCCSLATTSETTWS